MSWRARFFRPAPSHRVGDWPAAAEVRYVVQRPAKHRPLPDSFFAEVAAVYLQATADNHHDPRARIAHDSGYVPITVARWIGTARRKGYLPPTTPGKATGRPNICRTCGRPL